MTQQTETPTDTVLRRVLDQDIQCPECKKSLFDVGMEDEQVATVRDFLKFNREKGHSEWGEPEIVDYHEMADIQASCGGCGEELDFEIARKFRDTAG